MAEPRENRVKQIATQAVQIYRYLQDHPLMEAEDIAEGLHISRAELYRQLMGLQDDPRIYRRGRYMVLDKGRRLKKAEVEEYLEGIGSRKSGPPPLERILYLYHKLFISTGNGGMDMMEIKSLYRELMDDYGVTPSEAALKRMIYRDLKELNEMGIALQRPYAGQPRYALMNMFLPRLKREQAILMYLSTLLFPDTLMDEAASCVRQQMEKASLNRMASEARSLKKLVCVVGDTLVNPESFGGCLEQLISGMLNRQLVEFQYSKMDGSSSRRALAPLGLICKRGVWYLVASQRNGSNRRTFRVDQISRVRLRKEYYNYPADFDLALYLGSSWGIMNEGAPQKVLIRFAPHVAQRLSIMRYHPSQEIRNWGNDGSIEVSYEVSGFTELTGWLMQWGDAAEVLEPSELRRKMGEAARRLASRYID